MDLIKTTKLTKYYGKSRGIADLDLTVEQGEFFGFIGPNGAGKSTTIRILLGLIAPTSGSATVFGKDVSKKKVSILQNVGYLPSEALFYPGMKVKDILKLSADLRKKDCTAEARLLVIAYSWIQTEIDDLSFGNRKKVAIVCALQHRPNCLCWTNQRVDLIR
ncbi:ABC transporter ATP-binding protein [Allobaculum sp. JKK-2023]|uniref:ABC transporter ATP-binding protein n=1 Tax=Allobaculum sp. JKK-2023 TaxID=3108943 RepID=UPI002B05B025|nr:ABC transporter ATP-binding protein [Allobaculum sp. JKK-2023]